MIGTTAPARLRKRLRNKLERFERNGMIVLFARRAPAAGASSNSKAPTLPENAGKDRAPSHS